VSERPRIRVAVLGGGRSSEHEVSLRSAASVVGALDPERFDVVPVQIDRGGAWQIEYSAQPSLEPGARQIEASARLSLEPGAENRSLVPSAPAGLPAPAGIGPIDVVLPILHGPFGEDGRLQGLLDMINIPYVGSGVAASALTMDKDKVKYVLRGVGIAVADHVVLRGRCRGGRSAGVSLLREAGQPRLQRRHQQGHRSGRPGHRRRAGVPPRSHGAGGGDDFGPRGGAGRARKQRSAGQPAG
jgi:D-alanine-D-alanine ligase